MKTDKPPLYIIDGHSLIYRSFYAIKELSNSSGQPTNAVFGFLKILNKLFDHYHPQYCCITFDSKGPTTRHKQYAEYKIHRKPMPQDLISQLPFITEVVKAYRIPILQVQEIEADDIIATLALQADKNHIPSVIVSNDKDIYQIGSDTIKILNIYTEQLLGPEEIKEKMGIGPEQIVDFLALAGDSSDNVPGVPGIGSKTATALLSQFPDIETLLNGLPKIENQRIRNLIDDHTQDALLSKQLVQLNTDVSIPDFILDNYRIKEPDYDTLKHLFSKLEFRHMALQISKKATRTEAENVVPVTKEKLVSLKLPTPVPNPFKIPS